MNCSTRSIVIIIVIVSAFFIIMKTVPNKIEGMKTFQDDKPGRTIGYHDLLVPDPRQRADLNTTVFRDDMDPNTIQKLEQTILQVPSVTSAAEVAYNDVGAKSYRHGEIRPFNESNSLVSDALAESDSFNADMFGNTYYMLWQSDQDREADQVAKKAKEIMNSGVNCVNFQNVNQCMSVCNDTKDCTGFYIDQPNKCCMLLDPAFVTNRNRYNRMPYNIDVYGQKLANNMIRYDDSPEKKVIFNYVKNNEGNGAYQVDMSRKECKSLCPKCIMGRCPQDYRCRDLTADPRYNQSCIITNEDRYNENTGDIFDGPNIQALDSVYGLDQYAGYDDSNEPVLRLPRTDRFELTDNIVPTQRQLDDAFYRYDKFHLGPNTFGPNSNWVDYDLARQTIRTNEDQEISYYNPAAASDNSDQIASRGGNDDTAFGTYFKYISDPVPVAPMVTKKQVENFAGTPTRLESRDSLYNKYVRRSG